MNSYILMILVVIIYSGNILVGKLINELSPFTITFFRLLIAFVVLLPIGFRSAWNNRSIFFEYKMPLLLMTVTGITLFNTFIYGALQFTTASNVAVLESVIPALTVVLSAVLLKERLQKMQWGGVLISIIGAIWVVIDGKISHLLAMNWNVGDVLMIGAIISWSFYSILVKKYMHLFPPFAAIFVMTGISVLVLLPIVTIEWSITGLPKLAATPTYVVSLLFMGIFPSFIALILFNRAVATLGASQASVFLNLLPVFTMLGAYLWLGESITGMQMIGAFIVIFGVMVTTQVITVRSKKERVVEY
ncbi:DMT family transporter [Alkalihalobacillus sp. MEB130]|uniref:DMT family transporter n=1 Tax=Alkalihalobacillus sp. MEB130 TaxID=2976704 RepID=UPI0028DF3A21|nr:DMT family transporter [Alkalihalobacillus sp. MEB130]MDT8863054.1 DMT family transporter [Alkalihalobacillus sp. MEB130]